MKVKNCYSIALYDSGIGGLTTLSEAVKILPNEKFLYFADDKNCPYGNKDAKEIKLQPKKTEKNIDSHLIICVSICFFSTFAPELEQKAGMQGCYSRNLQPAAHT